MHTLRRWGTVLGTAIVLALASATAAAQACAGFNDVAANDPFCPSVEWLKNRGITLGCGGPSYCPNQPVIRLSMAAFMKRLGTALTPVQLRVDAATGPVDLDSPGVVCQTADQPIEGFPRRAYVDLGFSATASADVGLAADLVVSSNGGTTWTALNAISNRGSIAANQWGGLADLGYGDVDVGQTLRWGVRLSRGGLAGTADLLDGRCQLRVLLFNRDGTTSPI